MSGHDIGDVDCWARRGRNPASARSLDRADGRWGAMFGRDDERPRGGLRERREVRLEMLTARHMLTARRDADLLERLLGGEDVSRASLDTRPEVRQLAALAGRIPRPAPAPDPLFVARLREELLTQASRRVAAAPPPLPTAATPPRRPTAPRALVLRRPRGLLPGLLAGAFGLAILLGGLSTRALPGDRLYEVKLSIGQAQVRLAGSDLGRGRALLGQVDLRLDEVDALVAAGDPRAQQVDVALSEAAADLAAAQRLLLGIGSGAGDPQALQALADASAQAEGRLRALAPMMPTGSSARLQQLLDLLAVGDVTLARQALACGAPCDDLRRALEVFATASVDSVATAGTTSGVAGPPGPPVTASTGGAGPGPATTVGAPNTAPAQAPSGTGLAGTATVLGQTLTVPPVTGTVTAPVTAPAAPPPTSVPQAPPVPSTPTVPPAPPSGCVVDIAGLCIGG